MIFGFEISRVDCSCFLDVYFTFLRIYYLSAAVSILSFWAIQFLSGASGIILSESAPAHFRSLPICGGQTQSNFSAQNFAHDEEKLNISTPTEIAIVTRELLAAAKSTGHIINHVSLSHTAMHI